MLTKTQVKEEFVKHVLPLLQEPVKQSDVDESFFAFADELAAEGEVDKAKVWRWKRYFGSGIKA